MGAALAHPCNGAATVRRVDVRIGVTQAPRELNVEVPDDERDDVRTKVDALVVGNFHVELTRGLRHTDSNVHASNGSGAGAVMRERSHVLRETRG